MPIRPKARGFRALKSSPRVEDAGTDEKTQVISKTCPNHVYRPRTKRMGEVAKYCALCMDQEEMAARWKKIRKALATVRCLTRKSSVAAKAASVPAAKTQWEISIVRTASRAAAAEGMRLLVVIN
jgi:hypothetical protein